MQEVDQAIENVRRNGNSSWTYDVAQGYVFVGGNDWRQALVRARAEGFSGQAWRVTETSIEKTAQ